METEQLIPYIAYLLPAVLVGIIAYYFFKRHIANEEGRRRYLIQKEGHKNSLNIRLQAYERLTLFLERINPNNLLIRLLPLSNRLEDYESLLINNIEQEYEHNLVQQIYVSQECWNLIQAAKNATNHVIRKTAMNEKVDTPDKLREKLVSLFMDEISPSQKALIYLKKEVNDLF
ncbi:MAG: hypothetical protein JKZ03_00255 [Flavobacteriaceae bacterium]|nr:hypothetical protein [Flavobacteriaceae bacterium]